MSIENDPDESQYHEVDDEIEAPMKKQDENISFYEKANYEIQSNENKDKYQFS